MFSSAGYFAYLIFQKPFLQKAGLVLIMAAFACHTLTLSYAYFSTGRMPVNNLFETLSIAAWSMAGVFLLFQIRFRINVLGVYAAPLTAVIMLIAYQLPRDALPNQNLFRSFWLVSHIIAVFAGDAAFALACGVGILYLLQERAIKTKAPGFFFRRLPSLELIDTTGYACIVSGFSLLTMGLITGIIYAKSVWGRFWSWDPKEIWSAITWIFYAILLHERLAVGWRGRRAAIMAIVGFAVLLFTFFGVNFLMQGHHGQFTKLK
jgi:cytochrome c-type biogenesis protein CcsB